MYINKHAVFFGICPFMGSTLTAPANTSTELSNHNTQAAIISGVLSDTYYALHYFYIERLKSP